MGDIYTVQCKYGQLFLVYIGIPYNNNKILYNEILYYKISKKIIENFNIIIFKPFIKITTKKDYYIKYYQQNREKKIEKQKVYYQENKNSYSLYYKKNKQQFQSHYKKHYEDNKEHYKQYNKNYYECNKEKLKQQQKIKIFEKKNI